MRAICRHDAPPIRNSFAAIPSGAWVAATIRPPRARWLLIRPAKRFCPAASSAEIGSSSSQTGRRTVKSRAIESRRRCPADRNAAGSARHDRARLRQGFLGQGFPPRRKSRRRGNRARTTGFPARSATVSARRDARDSEPVRARSVRNRRPQGRWGPCAMVKRPAISRSSEVLPDPLGPMTASASPEAAVKSRPENTSRLPARI